MKNIGVSVVICCYNSALVLPETIRHLAHQVVPSNISWEILIVNNASTDETTRVALAEWHRYNISTVPFSVIDEPIPGSKHARKKGILEAKYEYLLFCDDDNWLNSSYVATAFEILENDAMIGVLGGAATLEAEQPLQIDPLLLDQLTVSGIQHWAETDHWVYSAGAVFRKSILMLLIEKGWASITIGRNGNKLSSGEDPELCFIIHLSGYKIRADERLSFKHFVSHKKQSKQFILQMAFWLSYSYFLLNPYLIIIEKKERPLNKIIWKLLQFNVKIVIKEHLRNWYRLLRYSKGRTLEQQKMLQRSYGYIYSILQNSRRVIAHHLYLKKLLVELKHEEPVEY